MVVGLGMITLGMKKIRCIWDVRIRKKEELNMATSVLPFCGNISELENLG